MQSLTKLDGHQPDAIGVAHDVNQAMFDVLTPSPIDPGEYDLAMVPQSWLVDEADWEMQLTAIFRAARLKYPVLPLRPSSHDVTATLPVPISFTHQLIVGRIFSPSVRFAPQRRSHAGSPERRDAMPSLQQVDFDVHRAIVQTLVPRRVAEDAYSVGLKPSSYTASRESWASDLSEIHGTLRRKYAKLQAADLRATAAVTYDQPLANTKDQIVEEILGAGVWFPIG